jgi:hypothetical protein
LLLRLHKSESHFCTVRFGLHGVTR